MDQLAWIAKDKARVFLVALAISVCHWSVTQRRASLEAFYSSNHLWFIPLGLWDWQKPWAWAPKIFSWTGALDMSRNDLVILTSNSREYTWVALSLFISEYFYRKFHHHLLPFSINWNVKELPQCWDNDGTGIQ